MTHNCNRCGASFPVKCTNCSKAATSTIPPEGWLPCDVCNQSFWVTCPKCQSIQTAPAKAPPPSVPQYQQAKGQYQQTQPQTQYQQTQPQTQYQQGQTRAQAGSNSAPDGYDPQDIEANKFMAVLAYLGPLCFLMLFLSKKSKYLNFHAIQGVRLFCIFFTINIVCGILIIIAIGLLFLIISCIITVIYIITGITNAATGKVKKLPIIGG